MGAELFDAGRRKASTGMTKLSVAVRNFANAHKKTKKIPNYLPGGGELDFRGEGGLKLNSRESVARVY